jgi:hypothetical protein
MKIYVPSDRRYSIICLFLFSVSGAATCYFAPEVQGEFVMQSSVTMGQVQYSRVNITGESIPIWGICHKRIGNNVILMDE